MCSSYACGWGSVKNIFRESCWLIVLLKKVLLWSRDHRNRMNLPIRHYLIKADNETINRNLNVHGRLCIVTSKHPQNLFCDRWVFLNSLKKIQSWSHYSPEFLLWIEYYFCQALILNYYDINGNISIRLFKRKFLVAKHLAPPISQ